MALPGVPVIEPFIPNRGAMEMSGGIQSLGPSGHVDDFTRRNLPPPGQWPQLLLERPEFQYPDYLNAAVELTDRNVEKGFGDRVALIGNGRQRTYKELTDWSNRLAHALVENYGVKPGNRVLIRSGNNPALVAVWLAATKDGAVVVNTMPMLRAGELTKIVDKAEIGLGLTDSRISDELVACAKTSRFLKQVVNFDGTSNHDAELDRVALNKPVRFEAVKTNRGLEAVFTNQVLRVLNEGPHLKRIKRQIFLAIRMPVVGNPLGLVDHFPGINRLAIL